MADHNVLKYITMIGILSSLWCIRFIMACNQAFFICLIIGSALTKTSCCSHICLDYPLTLSGKDLECHKFSIQSQFTNFTSRRALAWLFFKYQLNIPAKALWFQRCLRAHLTLSLNELPLIIIKIIKGVVFSCLHHHRHYHHHHSTSELGALWL